MPTYSPLTIPILRGQSIQEYPLTLEKVHYLTVDGFPGGSYGVGSAKAHSGPVNVSRTTGQTPWYGSRKGYKSFVDYKIGYTGRKLYRQGVLKRGKAKPFFDPREYFRWWHNYYTRETKLQTRSMSAATQALTLGSSSYQSYTSYGGCTAGNMLNMLPTAIFTKDNLGLDWRMERIVPTAMTAEMLSAQDDWCRAAHRAAFYRMMEKHRVADLGVTLAQMPEIFLLWEELARGLLAILSPMKHAARDGGIRAMADAFLGVSALWLSYSYGIKPLVADTQRIVWGLVNSKTLYDSTNGRLQLLECGGVGKEAKAYEDQYTLRHYLAPQKEPYYYQGSNYLNIGQTGVYAQGTWGLLSAGAHKISKIEPIFKTLSVSDFPDPPAGFTQCYQASVKYRRKARHQYLVEVDSRHLLELFGLDGPMVLWELIPFSFIVDWVLKIGEYLSNNGITAGCRFLASLHSFEESWEYTDSEGSKGSVKDFSRITGNELDNVHIVDPRGLQVNNPNRVGTFIPKAEVEWGSGVSLEEINPRAGNAAALLALLVSALTDLKIARNNLSQHYKQLPRGVQQQLAKVFRELSFHNPRI